MLHIQFNPTLGSPKTEPTMQRNCYRSILFALLICAYALLSGMSAALAQRVATPTPSQTESPKDETKIASADEAGAVLESCDVKTENFIDIANRVKAEIAQHGAENVLLVVDIDNTTLAMEQPLGSDQWYNWQYDFIFRDAESPFRVAKDLNELLQIQGVLFALGKMRPPESELPSMIAELQNANCCTIVLTSRGPEFRSATERELKRNGYDFQNSALEIIEPTRERFMPYDKARPNTNGLSQQELNTLRDPRPISYSSGIMMTAGQHKGFMLRTLLARSKRNFRAIVFVDDHAKHTTRMTAAFVDSPITTACFHYVREQPNVDAFNEGDKP